MKVIIEKLDHYGRGITKINNKICFVPYTLPNEEVDITIIEEKKKYMVAKTNKIYNYSNLRCDKQCKYYSLCGGCNTMHIKYEYENEFKYNKICELLTKFTKYDKELVKKCVYDKDLFYRNKIVLHYNNKLGLYEKNSHKVINIDKCLLVNNKINKIIELLNNNLDNKSNIKDITIKIGNKTEQIMVIINGIITDYSYLLELVDILIINGKTITNNDKIISIIGNKKYYVSPNSFFQINSKITEKLYNEIYNVIKEYNSKNVLDLYCGTGSIGIYISDIVSEVLGIEVVEDAIKDANLNKELNKCNNIEFKVGKVEDIIDSIKGVYDTVIVDPPRNGLDKNVIDYLKNINSKLIIYVSCDPTTLMRDINLLYDNYELKYIKPFNMFPKTYHCESIVVLERK